VFSEAFGFFGALLVVLLECEAIRGAAGVACPTNAIEKSVFVNFHLTTKIGIIFKLSKTYLKKKYKASQSSSDY